MENPIIILLLSLSLAIAVTPGAYGQTKGTVDYKYLGIRFVIPDGWVGQETQAGYLIGSHTEPGIGLVTTHQYKTIEQLGQQAQQGIYDQNGTALTVTGQLEAVGNNGIGGEFQGTLEGQPVKAYILALVNPHGDGVTIMSATSPHLYAPTHKNLALQLAKSLEFYKAETPPVVDEWREALKNCRLTYMDSYYSGGGVGVGGYSTGGGYSSKEEIHLCAQGFFKYNSSSNISIDTGGAFGSSGGRGQGAGNWEVVGNSQGGATLRLNFHNGEVYEYVLDYRDKRTLLNGKRYFRTYANEGPEYAPDCN
jgi:hypothetical protein